MHENSTLEDGVKGTLRKAEVMNVPRLERDVCQATLSRRLDGWCEALRVDVDAHHFTWSNHFSKPERDGSRSTAAIQQAHPLLEARYEEGSLGGHCALLMHLRETLADASRWLRHAVSSRVAWKDPGERALEGLSRDVTALLQARHAIGESESRKADGGELR